MTSRLLIVPLLVGLGLGLSACEKNEQAGGTASAAAPKRDHRAAVSQGASLIDVRTPEEYSAKHVDGAKNIPVDEIDTRLSEIPKDKPVVVYCHSGGRSATAAKVLRGAGYDVIDVGGMKNW
jgi:rhodanese-related sulfurtransferase